MNIIDIILLILIGLLLFGAFRLWLSGTNNSCHSCHGDCTSCRINRK